MPKLQTPTEHKTQFQIYIPYTAGVNYL